MRDEDVGWLDVAMDDIFRRQVFEALVNLANNSPDFFLSHGTPFLESFFQIATLAELSHEVAVIGAL